MPSTVEKDAPTVDRVLVSQPDSSTLFMARRDELRLVMKPIRQIRDAEGNEVDRTLGVMVQFKDGMLRIPNEGPVTLTNGEAHDRDEVLGWLERHRLAGDKAEGFWRVDPVAPRPTMAELESLQTLAVELDAEGLRRFLELETGGWNRPELVEIANGTLERIEAREAQHAAEIAAASAQARKEGEAAATKAQKAG